MVLDLKKNVYPQTVGVPTGGDLIFVFKFIIILSKLASILQKKRKLTVETLLYIK